MSTSAPYVGLDYFREEDAGLFWGLLETRPYMRARAGLAQALWTSGDRDEAIAHYREMLRLNPGDNQGLRYVLAAALLEIGDDEALQELLKAYDQDGSPYWTYTKALLAFRAAGATKQAGTLLAEAVRSNAHVPAFLSGGKELLKFTGTCLYRRTANRGGMVGMITSGQSVHTALGSADACRLAGRSLRRSDFREIAGMRAGRPTPRESRARPARISPAVRVPGGRHGAGLARPGTRAGSV